MPWRIAKPAVFITSTGRTGTKYFAWLLNRYVQQCDAFHEPDVAHSLRLLDFLQKSKRFGILRLTVGKLSYTYNMRLLGLRYRKGGLTTLQAARILACMRASFVKSLCGSLYVESNVQLSGLLDVLPQAFPSCRIVWMVRDGREWVTSVMRHFAPRTRYGLVDLPSWIGPGRFSAKDCRNDPWAAVWDELTPFQKNCWRWSKENQEAVQVIERLPCARMWRFEDIFQSEKGHDHLRSVLDFVTRFPEGDRIPFELPKGVLRKKLHASSHHAFGNWTEWSTEQVAQFQAICGGMMKRLNYGIEDEWRKRCEKAIREFPEYVRRA